MSSQQTKPTKTRTVIDYLLVGGVRGAYFDSQARNQPNEPSIYRILRISSEDLRATVASLPRQRASDLSTTHEDILTCDVPLRDLLNDPEVKDLSNKLKRAFESHS